MINYKMRPVEINRHLCMFSTQNYFSMEVGFETLEMLTTAEKFICYTMSCSSNKTTGLHTCRETRVAVRHRDGESK